METVVLDCGSSTIRVGFGGADAPQAVFPAVVARGEAGDAYCGDESQVQHSRGRRRLRRPFQEGIVGGQWEDVEKLWHHSFHDELRCNPAEHAVLLAEQPDNPQANRQRAAEIMFETFGVRALSTQVSQVLSLYSTGRTTGAVLDCGEHCSRALAVWDGVPLLHSLGKLDLGGSHLTERMQRLLQPTADIALDLAGDVKERLGLVCADAEAAEPARYELPDGRVIGVAQERALCPEVLFRPALLDREPSGVQDVVHRAIARCDPETHRDLFCNVVLCGGSSLFPGFRDRVQAELDRLVDPSQQKVMLTAAPDRKFSAWIGGSIVASLPNGFATVSRAEFEETGRV